MKSTRLDPLLTACCIVIPEVKAAPETQQVQLLFPIAKQRMLFQLEVTSSLFVEHLHTLQHLPIIALQYVV
jgi:hypothetical protein